MHRIVTNEKAFDKVMEALKGVEDTNEKRAILCRALTQEIKDVDAVIPQRLVVRVSPHGFGYELSYEVQGIYAD